MTPAIREEICLKFLRYTCRYVFVNRTLMRFDVLYIPFVTLLLFSFFHHRGFDDPFITYRYARNIAHGDGFVYNLNEPVLSTTTPLYALLLAPLYQMSAPLPLASNAIGCIGLALGGFVIWRLGQRWQTPAAGVAGLLLFPTFPLFASTLGAETTVYIALVLLGFLAYARKQYIPSGVLFAAATLTRADAVVATAIVGIHFLLVRRERFPRRAISTYVVLIVCWFTFAWLYFGAPFPVTLAAKQQQGQMAISQTFTEGIISLINSYWNNPFYRLHFIIATVGTAYIWRFWNRWLLIPAWVTAYTMAYALLGVSRYFWYYAPLIVGVIVLVGLGVEALWRSVQHITTAQVAAISTSLLLLLLSTSQLRSIWHIRTTNDPRMGIYQQVGEWLRDNTPQNASVGTLEVGIIGYHANRRMIGFAGLLQPEAAHKITRESTYEDVAIWATRKYHPDYLVLQSGFFPRVEQMPAVQNNCSRVQTFEDDEYETPLIVYACHWQTKSGDT